MRRPARPAMSSRLTAILAIGAGLSVAALVWSGYRSVRGWVHSERILAERRAAESVDLAATAIGRDMRAVERFVLAEVWEVLNQDPPDEVVNALASVFARYPYPESFFAWRAGQPATTMVVYHRSDRPPPWEPLRESGLPFPVFASASPERSRAVFDLIRSDAGRQRRTSILETTLDEVPYQVVARLFYRDPLGESVAGIVGYTVNLQWAREHYFADVSAQVARVTGARPFAIVDARGHVLAGERRPPGGRSAVTRTLPVMFFDPSLVSLDPPAALSRETLTVEVDPQRDDTLTAATRAADRIIAVGALAASVLVVGLFLTVRATRAGAALAALRADFVATVTHDLKTPIASIRAIGETLARGRVTDAGGLRDYAQLIVQESRRLTRLVENLLAHARVTDETVAYAFEPVDLTSAVDDVLRGFAAHIDDRGFAVRLDLPADLSPVRADRTALVMLLDNLVDNAIRYSGTSRWIGIGAAASGTRRVTLVVSDGGVGIPADEIGQVTRKFFRGRHARTGGTGLGLAIVNRIVADHGGTLAIRSRPGQGTEVAVTLPTEEPDS